jgi:hypothetical protein
VSAWHMSSRKGRSWRLGCRRRSDAAEIACSVGIVETGKDAYRRPQQLRGELPGVGKWLDKLGRPGYNLQECRSHFRCVPDAAYEYPGAGFKELADEPAMEMKSRPGGRGGRKWGRFLPWRPWASS